MKNLFLTLIALVSLLSCSTDNEKTDYKLWYNKPANFFEESLVLGNGKMGATVYGGISKDSIFLNDLTLWAGEPVDPYMNPDAHKYMDAIRKALFDENYELADQLNRNLQGRFSQSYAPLGKFYLDFEHGDEVENYYRDLNISDATSVTTYSVDGINYSRELFVSNPKQLLVVKLKSSEPSSFRADFASLLKYQTETTENSILSHGYAPYHAEPSYRGKMENDVLFDPERGTRFTSIIQVKETNGEIIRNGEGIQVENATETILLVSVATSFNGFDKDPAKQGRDNVALAEEAISLSQDESFDELKNGHLEDYHSFFDRLEFELSTNELNNLPTDERLLEYARGAKDQGLEELYFHFGRYLLISSSRTPEVPANLQGLWNHYMRPPWSSNYTVNINVEENYWLSEPANLSDLHQPMLQWIENVAKTGEITAKTFYGAQRGWCAAHNSDIWAMSNPVGDFGQGNPVWASWNMGGTWLATHLWEHYVFTKDKKFLSEKAYPLMKGAAEFCLEMLVEGPNGYLVTAPSTSPENLYKTDKGYVGATLYGATSDLAMMRELFIQTTQVAEALDLDLALQNEMKQAISKMYPYQIGAKGNLQEWYHDWEDQDPQHRHQTHLFGLHPGHHISPNSTPELADACKNVLEVKGDETTGWSKGWRINLWARLEDGNRAYKLYRELLRFVDPSGLREEFGKGGGTYPNLLDAHPPFQIDGNFGGAAGVLEMLVQSSENHIKLFPAMPDVWSTGKLHGVKARGGFELNLDWEDGKIVHCEIISEKGGRSTVHYGNKEIEVNLNAGESQELLW